ncbi:MAG: PorV/PorQ family protein [Chitinivibrionales bacterium]
MSITRTGLRSIISLLCIYTVAVQAGVGESAVITLVFPPGARSTGMGETFTGLADDAQATFYNPAGLGQSPLANAWKAHTLEQDIVITDVASKKRLDFGQKERVWIGTNRGVRRYNGNVWETYEPYVIQEGDDLESIVKKFVDVDDEKLIAQAMYRLKEVNGIGRKKSDFLVSALSPAIADSVQDKQSVAQKLAEAILDLSSEQQNAAQIYGLIASQLDSASADVLSDSLTAVFEMTDTDFDELVEVKVPFDIVVTDSVTALTVDESERVWVGTTRGLWRYDGLSWSYFSMVDGLPSNTVTAIAIGPHSEIAVGTDKGLAVLSQGKWNSYTTQNGLPAALVTSIAFAASNTLYVGTPSGLAQKKDESWTVFDTADGLLNKHVTALLYDVENKLWIGGPDGVTIYSQTAWKRYKFPESTVSDIAEYGAGKVWIGTDDGAISYTAGGTTSGKDGKMGRKPPTWKVFHAKNALKGNNVVGVAVHGKDVWLATEKAVNQYDKADLQFLIAYEPLLPAFDISDLWHVYTSFVLPTEDWGTIGLTANFLNFGVNEWTDELGRELGEARAWEGVFYLSYGLPIKEDLSFGMNVKYIHSALASGYGPNGEGVGQTFAIDASVLKRNLFFENFDLGFNMQNMGPSIFYINREDADPIPFTLRLGAAYTFFETPLHSLTAVADFDREIVKSYLEKRPDPFWKAFYTDLIKMEDDQSLFDKAKEELSEVIGHVGLEYWYVNFLALRLGYMHDDAGSRKEFNVGIGLHYGNMDFDWSYIHSPEGSPARHQQWRASFKFSL